MGDVSCCRRQNCNGPFEEALSDLVSFQQLSCSLEPVIAKFLAHITRFIKCGKELLENKDMEDARTQFISAKRIVKAMLESSLIHLREAAETKISLAQISSLIEKTKSTSTVQDKENNVPVASEEIDCAKTDKKIAKLEDIKLLGQLMMNISAPIENTEENCNESVAV